MFLQEHTGK